MNEYQDRYGRPTAEPTDRVADPYQRGYVHGVPMAYPMNPDGGGVMWVNGVPQPMSRGTSRVMVGAIVFATCVLPLIILAAVFFMMPDFNSIFSGSSAPAAPDIPSITITPPR